MLLWNYDVVSKFWCLRKSTSMNVARFGPHRNIFRNVIFSSSDRPLFITFWCVWSVADTLMFFRRGFVYIYLLHPSPPLITAIVIFFSKNLENNDLKCQKIAGQVQDISFFFQFCFREVTPIPIGASGLRPWHCSELPSAAEDSSMGPFQLCQIFRAKKAHRGTPRHSAPIFPP